MIVKEAKKITFNNFDELFEIFLSTNLELDEDYMAYAFKGESYDDFRLKVEKILQEKYRKLLSTNPNNDTIYIDGAPWDVIRVYEDKKTYARSVQLDENNLKTYFITLTNEESLDLMKELVVPPNPFNPRYVGYTGKIWERGAKGEDIFYENDHWYSRNSNNINRNEYLTIKEIRYIDDIIIAGEPRLDIGDKVTDKRGDIEMVITDILVSDNQFYQGPFSYILDNGGACRYGSELKKTY